MRRKNQVGKFAHTDSRKVKRLFLKEFTGRESIASEIMISILWIMNTVLMPSVLLPYQWQYRIESLHLNIILMTLWVLSSLMVLNLISTRWMHLPNFSTFWIAAMHSTSVSNHCQLNDDHDVETVKEVYGDLLKELEHMNRTIEFVNRTMVNRYGVTRAHRKFFMLKLKSAGWTQRTCLLRLYLEVRTEGSDWLKFE